MQKKLHQKKRVDFSGICDVKNAAELRDFSAGKLIRAVDLEREGIWSAAKLLCDVLLLESAVLNDVVQTLCVCHVFVLSCLYLIRMYHRTCSYICTPLLICQLDYNSK